MDSDFDVDTSMRGTLAISVGVLSLLYGIIGSITGGYLLASTKSIPNDVKTMPMSMLIGIKTSSKMIQEAQISNLNSKDRHPKYKQIKKIHYSALDGTWNASIIPNTMQILKMRSRRNVRRNIPKRHQIPATKIENNNTKKTSIVAVFNIEDKGVNLSKKKLDRLSDYLSMKIAATSGFRVIPREMLKKRLLQQKKDSFKKNYSQSFQIEIGKELAAQKTLSTTIVKLGSKCIITSVLYDLLTAASEGGASVSGDCTDDGIVITLEKVVQQLENKGN